MVIYQGDNDEKFPSGPYLSPGGGWGHALYPYVKNVEIYTDPQDPTKLPRAQDWTPGTTVPTHVYSYGFNSNLGGVEIARSGMIVRKAPVAGDKMENPSRTVTFFEVADAVGLIDHAGNVPPGGSQYVEYESPTGNTTGNPLYTGNTGLPGQTFPDGLNPDPHILHVSYATGNVGGRILNGGAGSTARHNGMANYAFADGHAKAMRPERVSGGADAVEAHCDQGTVTGQTGKCAGQKPWMAAGAYAKTFDATFSAK